MSAQFNASNHGLKKGDAFTCAGKLYRVHTVVDSTSFTAPPVRFTRLRAFYARIKHLFHR